MTIVTVTRRPPVYTYTRWTGDNMAELEAHYSAIYGIEVTFGVDGSGALTRAGTPLPDQSPVPVGNWFTHAAMASIPDADFADSHQELPGEAPYSYSVSGT